MNDRAKWAELFGKTAKSPFGDNHAMVCDAETNAAETEGVRVESDEYYAACFASLACLLCDEPKSAVRDYFSANGVRF